MTITLHSVASDNYVNQDEYLSDVLVSLDFNHLGGARQLNILITDSLGNSVYNAHPREGGSSGSYSFDLPQHLADGTYFLQVIGTGGAGQGTESFSIITQDPTVTASQTLDGAGTTDFITVTAAAEAIGNNQIQTVVVFDGNSQLGNATFDSGSGNWLYTAVNLSFGTHNIHTVTTDTAGNQTTTNLDPLTVTSLVHNGGFESGDLSDWTLSGNTGFLGVTSGSTPPNGGNFAAFAGPVGSLGNISQHIATQAGQQYDFSFDLQGDGGIPNEFLAQWNGTTITGSHLVNAPAQGYTHYSFTETATSNDTVILLGFQNDPGFWFIDNVSVVLHV
jgi:hypothetical protein